MNWITTIIVDLDIGNNIKVGDHVECERGWERFNGNITSIQPNGISPNAIPCLTVEVHENDYIRKKVYKTITPQYIQKLNGKEFKL